MRIRIEKGQSKVVNQRRTYNTMTRRKKTKNDLQKTEHWATVQNTIKNPGGGLLNPVSAQSLSQEH
jgi:hypothetical protein